jgi:hypothetical protein
MGWNGLGETSFLRLLDVPPSKNSMPAREESPMNDHNTAIEANANNSTHKQSDDAARKSLVDWHALSKYGITIITVLATSMLFLACLWVAFNIVSRFPMPDLETFSKPDVAVAVMSALVTGLTFFGVVIVVIGAIVTWRQTDQFEELRDETKELRDQTKIAYQRLETLKEEIKSLEDRTKGFRTPDDILAMLNTEENRHAQIFTQSILKKLSSSEESDVCVFEARIIDKLKHGFYVEIIKEYRSALRSGPRFINRIY